MSNSKVGHNKNPEISTDSTVLAIVVPCLNEELVIDSTADRLIGLLDKLKSRGKIDQQSYLYFVDDGSEDQTWSKIVDLHGKNGQIKGLKLASNVGHQNALMAGLLKIRKRIDCVVSIDADLQDDISVIETFVDYYCQGYDVVYGVRNQRRADSLFKKYTAKTFYKLLKVMGVSIVDNHADFRLASRRVIESLKEYREVNLFLRGIFPLLGFRSTSVLYDRSERVAGESKYTVRKMLSLAWNGITSFSVAPLRLITVVGLATFVFAGLIGIWVLKAYFRGEVVPGWSSLLLTVAALGGIQLFCIGLIGEYIGKIYKEVKARPRFIVEQELS